MMNATAKRRMSIDLYAGSRREGLFLSEIRNPYSHRLIAGDHFPMSDQRPAHQNVDIFTGRPPQFEDAAVLQLQDLPERHHFSIDLDLNIHSQIGKAVNRLHRCHDRTPFLPIATGIYDLLVAMQDYADFAAAAVVVTVLLIECTSDPIFTICSNWLNWASSDTICVGSC